MEKPIMSIDLGGTNMRLALVNKNIILKKEVYPSKMGLLQPINEFLKDVRPKPARIVIGIAGPLSPDRRTAQMTNISLNIDANMLEKELRLKITLINDFEAMSYGILSLKDNDMIVLSQGIPSQKGNKAIIGAGTGLGEGMLVYNEKWNAVASEGGHSLMAGTSNEMSEFIKFIIKNNFTNGAKYPYYECILSGRGLFSAYLFYQSKSSIKLWESPNIKKEILTSEDRPATVSRLALEGKSKACACALDLFVTAFAEECMNLALKAKATGGVYIVGNIAQKNRQAFIPNFTQRFLNNKEPNNPLLEFLKKIPIYLVTSTDIALLGATQFTA